MNGMVNACILPSCKGGGTLRGIEIVHPADPGLVHPHPPAPPHVVMGNTTGNWQHHPCNEPMCHEHHHHHHEFANFALFESNGPYIYQSPEPDCWRWSYRLHHWVWICGPYYPSY
jgi:hypothetical protein